MGRRSERGKRHDRRADAAPAPRPLVARRRGRAQAGTSQMNRRIVNRITTGVPASGQFRSIRVFAQLPPPGRARRLGGQLG
jgi:hypothetical protein